MGWAFALAAALLLAGGPSALAAPSVSVLPIGNREVFTMTAGSDGGMWFIDATRPAVVRVSMTGRIKAFRLPFAPNDQFSSLISGPDANLWFADNSNLRRSSATIEHMTLTGQLRDYPVRGLAAGGGQNLGGLAAGPDGAIWFTVEDVKAARVGRLTLSGRQRFVVSSPWRECCGPPSLVASAPDGALWAPDMVNEAEVDRITTKGGVTRFHASRVLSDSYITVGSDGNLWLGLVGGIARITPRGSYTWFPFPSPYGADDTRGLAAGPDGELWFIKSAYAGYGATNDAGAGEIDRNGHMSIYPLAPDDSNPLTLAAGPDGKLWISTEFGGPGGSAAIFKVTPQEPASGWPSAATPHLRRLSLSRNQVLIGAACSGSRGLLCGGWLRVAVEQGARRANLSAPVTVAAGTTTTITLTSAALAKRGAAGAARMTASFDTRDFLGRRRHAAVRSTVPR